VILAISGSLRRDSLNSAALRAAACAAARTDIVVELDDSPRRLPHFDPDQEARPPQTVRQFRTTCAQADAVLLAVPEYAFGIPGVLKNAIDWTVGDGALAQKPVAVLSVAQVGRGANVRRALADVLNALDCHVSWHHVPVHPSLLVDGEISDPHVVTELARVVSVLDARSRFRSDGADPALSA
jgi:chromate reductase